MFQLSFASAHAWSRRLRVSSLISALFSLAASAHSCIQESARNEIRVFAFCMYASRFAALYPVSLSATNKIRAMVVARRMRFARSRFRDE